MFSARCLKGSFPLLKPSKTPSSILRHKRNYLTISTSQPALNPINTFFRGARPSDIILSNNLSANSSRTIRMEPEPVTNGVVAPKKVFFFDIDNCLYPKSAKVHDMMAELIAQYFEKHLSLPQVEARRLRREYYQNYGLAIEGLVRHHQIDPLEYNAKVDDALPLDGIIFPQPELKELLADIDRSKVKLWLLTNGYINHANRVIRLLDLEGVFDGLTFCDYANVPLICKPHPDMYHKAMKDAGVEKYEDCYFVDDSYNNCRAAQKLGWTTAHLIEADAELPRTQASKHQIRHLSDLRDCFPEFFKSRAK